MFYVFFYSLSKDFIACLFIAVNVVLPFFSLVFNIIVLFYFKMIMNILFFFVFIYRTCDFCFEQSQIEGLMVKVFTIENMFAHSLRLKFERSSSLSYIYSYCHKRVKTSNEIISLQNFTFQ